MPTCPNCKAPAGDENKFCPLCGTGLGAAAPAPSTPPASRAAAGVIDSSAGATRSLKRVEPAADDLIGKLVDGRYRILERIGEGGVGVVYRAEHVQLRRTVAVKVLHALYAVHPEFRLRFEREALAATKAAHPGCVAVLDFGTFEARPYLVMEFVEGRLLSQRLERGPLPPAEAVLLTRQILRALRHTHELGIVHRDLKPGNIMLCEPARTGSQVKLLDFGLAKNLGQSDASSSTLTQAGSVFGTPGYLAPEQALGLAVDERSDLYSLGVVLFEMVCGRRPFVADDQLDVIRAHINTPPPGARQLRPEVSPALESVITRALEKDRARRFQSADELNDALGGVPEGDPRGAAPGPAAGAPPPTLPPVSVPPPVTAAPAPPGAGLIAPTLPPPVAAALPPAAPTFSAAVSTAGTTAVPAPAALRPAGRSGGLRVGLVLAGVGVVLLLGIGLALLGASWLRGVSHRRSAPHGAFVTRSTRPAPRPHGRAAPAARPVTPVAAPAAPGAVAGAISPIRTGAEAAASPELRRAEAALAAGRVGTAIPAARRAAAKHRSDARPHLVLGHAYYRKGWHGDALDEFRKAARLDPATRSDPAMLLDAVGCLSRRATAARARAFLLEIGAPAAPVLREAAARHHDADVRARAADTLAQLGQ